MKKTEWMKKTGLYCCAAALAFGLTACGGDSQESDGTQGTESTSETGSLAETGSSESTGSPEASGSSEAGDSSQESGGWGDLGADGWSEEMSAVREAVVTAVGEENYWPDMPMTTDLFEMYYGITPDMCEDYMAETPMISAKVDALVVIKAKEGQADAVETAMNSYREMLVNDTMQYPANLSKIQASQVERLDDYIVFVQLGGDTTDKSDEDALKQCQEANKLAIEAIRGIIGGN